MTDFRYTPKGDRKVANLLLGLAALIAAVGLVLNVTETQALLGQILFFLGAVGAVIVLTRYFFTTYTYTLTADGYFEVSYTSGRRTVPAASFFLRDIRDVRVLPYGERPRGTVAFYASLRPPKVMAVRVLLNGSEVAVLIEADEAFSAELLRRVEIASQGE